VNFGVSARTCAFLISSLTESHANARRAKDSRALSSNKFVQLYGSTTGLPDWDAHRPEMRKGPWGGPFRLIHQPALR
jgi:hypothetical protein